MSTVQKPERYLGRDEEWQSVTRSIQTRDSSSHLFYIAGPGGVGKTAFFDLLYEVYRVDKATLVLDPIDFDDLTLRLPDNLMRRLATRLQEEVLPREPFLDFLSLVESRESILTAVRQRQVNRAFVAGLKQIVGRQRLVMLIDTLEKAPIWFPDFFAEILSGLQNLVVVLAGRPESQRMESDLLNALRNKAGTSSPAFNIQAFQWSGLDDSLCDVYFSSTDRLSQLESGLTLLDVPASGKLTRNVWGLAQGIPFQVNLFVEMLCYLESGTYRFRKQIDQLLRDIDEASPETVATDLELRHRFQHALVAPFALNYEREGGPGTGVDDAWLTSRILLLIAHVNHYMAHALGGFDAATLATLDDMLSEERVQEGLQHIEENRHSQFSFIKLFRDARGKARIGLHDEMARMLNQFAWPRIDPPGSVDSVRNKISELLVADYDARCLARYHDAAQSERATPDAGPDTRSGAVWLQAAAEPEGQALLLARTFHAMYRDLKNGWEWTYHLSEQIFRRSYFDTLLYESVDEYVRYMRGIPDPDFRARMDVWRAASLIARADLQRAENDLELARELLENSIATWHDQYRNDEEKVMQQESRRYDIESLRREMLSRQREQPSQAKLLQPTVDGCDRDLAAIRRSVREQVQFRDLERALTSLGFVHRLEGNWEQAIGCYQRALTYSRWLGSRNGIAELANNIANVYLMWGRLPDAALWAQLGSIIRKHLGLRTELGHSYWVLGMVNWRVGNTYECRKYLNQALSCYQEPVDRARVYLYEGYTCYRIGDTVVGRDSLEEIFKLRPGQGGDDRVPPVRSFALLEEARHTFENYNRLNDLSWTYNVVSRAHRHDVNYAQAEEAAHKALDLAQDAYRISEAHLSLCMLYYRWAVDKLAPTDSTGALTELAKVDKHYAIGQPLANKGRFIDLLSVYEGVKGNADYMRGEHEPDRARQTEHFDNAFQHYQRECRVAAKNKALRFERALNEVVADRLARMPVEHALRYADVLTDPDSWQADGLAREHLIIKSEVDELKLFLGLPERAQIDAMERSFNKHMRRGEFVTALKEATDALGHFHRYNWHIDTVRVLLKRAQAHRKLAQFTSARRQCKQALFIVEQLLKKEPSQIELIVQKAHADFTMGRILWEIGNTAEAAAHFRKAREAYLKHSVDENGAVAAEMCEGLARSMQYEGFMRFRVGEFDQAIKFLDWAEGEYRDIRNSRRIAKVLNLKARIYRDRDEPGDTDQARRFVEEALKILKEEKEEDQDRYAIAECYLTHMILEYEESRKRQTAAGRLASLAEAEQWYLAGARFAHENGYALLQAVYEGVLGNILFDRLGVEAGDGAAVDLKPAFNRYLEECRWDSHFEKRRFFRSLDLLMQRLSTLSRDEISYYNEYLNNTWKEFADAGKLPGREGSGQRSAETEEYVRHMEDFCRRVEEFSEYIARP